MEDRYGAGLKGLNMTGGSNRFKFQGKQSRAKRVDVDVAHKVRAEGFLDADKAQAPDEEGGSFFQQELDRCKELNVTPPFKRFYYKAWPLVQSLAELVHHAPKVVDMLLALLEDPSVAAQAGNEVLQLMSVLGRDLQSSFFPYFTRVSRALVAIVAGDDVAPEICGRVLRCLGFLLKFVARPLSTDMTAVRQLYSPLLGHRKDFVRRMSAQSLAPAVRRLKPKAMRKHARQVVGALAAGSVMAEAGDAPGGARLRADTLDGCSQLLFYVAKGVHGRTHSQAPVLLRVLMDSVLPPKEAEGGSDIPERSAIDRRRREVERAWCYELASAFFALLVEHVRSPHSADLWLQLHYGVGNAIARHRASIAAVKRTAGDDANVACGGSGAVERTVDLLSQAVGHMGGILLREPSIAVQQAALLAEVLTELTRDDTFWHKSTSPGCRRAIIELLAVSLCGLHQQQRLVKTTARVISAVVAPPASACAGFAASSTGTDEHPALILSRSLLGGAGAERTHHKPPPMRVTRKVALRPLLEACAGPLAEQTGVVLEVLLRVIHGTGMGMKFIGAGQSPNRAEGRDRLHDASDDERAGEEEDDDMGALVAVAGTAGVSALPIGMAAGRKLLDMCCSCVEQAGLPLKDNLRRQVSSLSFLARISAGARAMPAEASHALAALRCIPTLVGSFASTGDARREAIERSLRAIDHILAASASPETPRGQVALKCEGDDALKEGSSDHLGKRSRKRGAGGGVEELRESATHLPSTTANGREEGWKGGHGGGADKVASELAVFRSCALEAGVAVCCSAPSLHSEAERNGVLQKLQGWHAMAMTWLRASPTSIATLRALEVLLRGLRGASGERHSASLSTNALLPVLALLEPNLASESRLLRLACLRVLARFNPLPFTKSSGEDSEGVLVRQRESGRETGDEECPFLEIAEALESLPISIAAERDLMWRLGQLEVLGRSDYLPQPYARVMATYALGLLRMKFSAVWPRATSIVGALCRRSHHRDAVWEPIHKALRGVMPPPLAKGQRGLTTPSQTRGAHGAEQASGDVGAVPQRSGDASDEDDRRPILDAGTEQGPLPAAKIVLGELPASEDRAATIRSRPWVPQLLSEAAALDSGPKEEMQLPLALEGVFLDQSVRQGLNPEAGVVPLWASTDADAAFAQVWGILSQCPELLQQHSRTVVPMFLGFMCYQYLGPQAFMDDPEVLAVDIERHLLPAEREREGPSGWGPLARRSEEEAGLDGSQASAGSGESGLHPREDRAPNRRSVRGRLAAVLGVFADAPGPKSFYKQRVLFRLYRALLVMPEEKIAALALRCMLSYKPSSLVPYKSSLEGLMDEESFRDELVVFSLASEGGGGGATGDKLVATSLSTAAAAPAGSVPKVEIHHRPGLLPVIIRLVYGRLSVSSSRGRSNGHGGPPARRAAVLSFLSGLRSDELAELFALMVRPFVLPPLTSPSAATAINSRAREGEARLEEEEGPAQWDDIGWETRQAAAVLERAASVQAAQLASVSSSRQAGFLKMAQQVAKQLGQRALPYVEIVLGLVLAVLQHCNAVSDAERRARVEHVDQLEQADDELEDEEDQSAQGGGVSAVAASNEEQLASSGAESGSRVKISPGALRSSCLHTLAELFSQFATSFDFAAHEERLWTSLADPIKRLPGSTVGAVKAPALLTLAETLSESEGLLRLLSPPAGGDQEDSALLIPAVLDCISAGSARGRAAGPAVVGSALTFVQRLLLHDDGSLLAPHLNRLITNFGARLRVTGMSGRGTGSGGALDSHIEQGLAVLARVAEMAATKSPSPGAGGRGEDSGEMVDASSMSELVALLIPSLQPDRRGSDDGKSSIIRTIAALAGRVDSPGARRAWSALSRLLGPAGSRPSGMSAAGPRGELVRALEAFSQRSDLSVWTSVASSLLVELNARDAVLLDEPDFGRVVPAYNALSEGTAWADVIAAGGDLGQEDSGGRVAPLGGLPAAAPIVQHCFHCLHDQEAAVRGAAGAALKRLVREVADREKLAAGPGEERCAWRGLLRTAVMSGLRAGMACRTETVRKGFISLLRETLYVFQGANVDGRSIGEPKTMAILPSDLWVLARDDDPESDFFLNACHMQVHRRARALAKARKVIEDAETRTTATIALAMHVPGGEIGAQPLANGLQAAPAPVCPFRVSTLVHFLLPLALHPLYEAAKSAEAGLVGQAVQLTVSIARHLPWTHYNTALRNLMQQVSAGSGAADGPERERAMVSAMCGMLDGFHFELVPPPTLAPGAGDPEEAPTAVGAGTGDGDAAADGGDAVWRAVNGRLLASLRRLLVKEVPGKSGGKEQALRAPVALGMLNLIRRLPKESFELQLQPLLMTVCQSLKSRDSSARDAARDTLAKMARDLGPAYLKQVITELSTYLVTGFQLHVRTFTLHTVLKAVADAYAPPNPPSVDVRKGTSKATSLEAPAVAAAPVAGNNSGNNSSTNNPPPTAGPAPMAVEDEDSVARDGAGVLLPAVPSSIVRPPFDACIVDITELLMEDLFGEIAAAKEAQGANVVSSKMKEAKGQKAYDSFEITARTLLFRPTYTVLAPDDAAAVSSVHALVRPALTRLEGCEKPREVGKLNEALTRIGMGLAANPSVTDPEMLLYVHATVAPFLMPQTTEEEHEEDEAVEEADSDDSSDSDEDSNNNARRARAKGDGKASRGAKNWKPSEAGTSDQSRGAALGQKRRREWESVQVLDGASAPKHTGRDRHDGRAAGRLRAGGPSSLTNRGTRVKGVDLGDPAALGAVTLALGLLNSKLKAEATARGVKGAAAMDRRGDVVRAMADPFVPLLTRCIGKNPHTSVVLLSLKSLCYLLHWDLPSMKRCAPLIGRHVLARLVRGGVGGIRGEMGQACFKSLSVLFKSQVHVFGVADEKGAGGKVDETCPSCSPPPDGAKRRQDKLFGLSAKQLRALLVVLQMAVAETEHQNATFTLIRVVVKRKVMLPEVYDLMTKLAELAVTSHRPTLRASAAQTFLSFLLQYPLGEKRLQFHLNQVMSGITYEHAEGRLAALHLCTQLVKRLPEPNLDQLASVFYLALVVRLVNDAGAQCRSAAAVAINTLLTRVSGEVFYQLLEFTEQWFGHASAGRDSNGSASLATGADGQGAAFAGGAQGAALKRTAAQASGLFVQARPELIRRGANRRLPLILSALASMLPPRAADVIGAERSARWGDPSGGDAGADADAWEGVYHAVLSIGKAFDALPGACNAALCSKRSDKGLGGERIEGGDALRELFDRLREGLLYPHAWVRLAAARVWGSLFSKRDPGTLAMCDAVGNGDVNVVASEASRKSDGYKGDGKKQPGRERQDASQERITTAAGGHTDGQTVAGDGGQEFLRRPRQLFRLCQNVCSQLDRSQVDPKLTEQCVKNLVFIGRAMYLNPQLCFAEDKNKVGGEDVDEEPAAVESAAGSNIGGDRVAHGGDGDDAESDEDTGESPASSIAAGDQRVKHSLDPLAWVFRRMSNMVVHKGESRRRAVFSWFAAMATVHEPAVSAAHLRLMLFPLRRAILDAEAGGVEAREKNLSATRASGRAEKELTAAELATEVMELLESKVGSGVFLETLTSVNMEISRKRVERKRQRAVEKATDPVAAAERRKERLEAGKNRKRRKVEESAKLRGGTKGMRSKKASGRSPAMGKGTGSGRGGRVPSRGRGGRSGAFRR